MFSMSVFGIFFSSTSAKWHTYVHLLYHHIGPKPHINVFGFFYIIISLFLLGLPTPNKNGKEFRASTVNRSWQHYVILFLCFIVLKQSRFLKVFNVFWDIKTTINSNNIMTWKGRTDLKQTWSSSLMAAMLFWNLSRLQKVEIPSFVFWTRTCSRPPCSRFSASDLSCLQQMGVKLFLAYFNVDITCLQIRPF